MNFYHVIKVLQIEVMLVLLSEYQKRGDVCTFIRLSLYRWYMLLLEYKIEVMCVLLLE